MTFRPRIRTIKPEMWADEKVGALSRDARLLFVGLITMADDEGRLRALPAGIIGHVFPYDDDVTTAKLGKWMRELVGIRLVVTYESGGRPYIWLPGWSNHQKVNRANPSELPQPPVRDVDVNGHDRVTDGSLNDHGSVRDDAAPHAQARAIADRDRDLDPPKPPQGGEVVKFDRKPVPSDRLELAERLLTDFNAQAGTGYNARTGNGKPSDPLTRIIGALTRRPDVDEPTAHRAVQWQLARPYWDGPAHPGVVYGPGVFDKALEAAKTNAASGNQQSAALRRAYQPGGAA